MIDALRSFGVEITIIGQAEGCFDLHLKPSQDFRSSSQPIHCGLAGTVMRFVPPVAMLSSTPTHFIGDDHASHRPMAELLSALTSLGAHIDNDRLPFTMIPPQRIKSNHISLDSSATSQYISALLLSAARYPAGLIVEATGSIPSAPHIEMTIEMLNQRGVHVDHHDHTWTVSPQTIAGGSYRIEPDLTNAAVFLSAAIVAGGKVSVPAWPKYTTQPGDMIRQIATRMGAIPTWDDGVLTIESGASLHPIDIDLHPASELTPVVAALAACAHGRSVLRGVGHIRGHETDRLAALENELRAVGIAAYQTDDGMVIDGVGQQITKLSPQRILHTYGDHRMAHFAALLGLVIDGITVDDISVVSKTMPDFVQRWQQLTAL